MKRPRKIIFAISMKEKPRAEMETVLVTGSEGFIGKALMRRLQEQGIPCYGVDVRQGFDLASPGAIAALPPFKVAIHLAARTFVPDSWKDPYAFFHTNVNTTLNLLEACRLHKAKMVLASSYVYGIPRELPIAEDHPTAALNPYAYSKLSAEFLCRGYAQASGIPLLILRPFNVYGPGQDPRFLIASIIGQWKTGRVSLQDPAPKRDYLFVDDMVDAYLKSIQLDFEGIDIVNIGSGTSFSVKEMTDKLAELLPGKGEINYSGVLRKNEIPETCADIRKAQSLLQWSPRVSIEEGLRKTIEAAYNDESYP